MKFSVRDLFLVTAILALLIVGFTERARLIGHYEWLLRDEHARRLKAEEEIGIRQQVIKRVQSMPRLHPEFDDLLPTSSAPALSPPKNQSHNDP